MRRDRKGGPGLGKQPPCLPPPLVCLLVTFQEALESVRKGRPSTAPGRPPCAAALRVSTRDTSWPFLGSCPATQNPGSVQAKRPALGVLPKRPRGYESISPASHSLCWGNSLSHIRTQGFLLKISSEEPSQADCPTGPRAGSLGCLQCRQLDVQVSPADAGVPREGRLTRATAEPKLAVHTDSQRHHLRTTGGELGTEGPGEHWPCSLLP